MAPIYKLIATNDASKALQGGQPHDPASCDVLLSMDPAGTTLGRKGDFKTILGFCSGLHCKLTYDKKDSCWFITDTSTNGTYIRPDDSSPWSRVPKGEQRVLSSAGWHIRLGSPQANKPNIVPLEYKIVQENGTKEMEKLAKAATKPAVNKEVPFAPSPAVPAAKPGFKIPLKLNSQQKKVGEDSNLLNTNGKRPAKAEPAVERLAAKKNAGNSLMNGKMAFSSVPAAAAAAAVQKLPTQKIKDRFAAARKNPFPKERTKPADVYGVHPSLPHQPAAAATASLLLQKPASPAKPFIKLPLPRIKTGTTRTKLPTITTGDALQPSFHSMPPPSAHPQPPASAPAAPAPLDSPASPPPPQEDEDSLEALLSLQQQNENLLKALRAEKELVAHLRKARQEDQRTAAEALAEYEALKAKFGAFTAQRDNSADLEAQLKSARESASKALTLYEESKTRIAELENRAEQAEAAAREAQSQATEQKNKIDSLEEELQKAKAEAERQKSLAKSAGKEAVDAREALRAHKAFKATLPNRVASEEQQNVDNQRIVEILDSTEESQPQNQGIGGGAAATSARKIRFVVKPLPGSGEATKTIDRSVVVELPSSPNGSHQHQQNLATGVPVVEFPASQQQGGGGGGGAEDALIGEDGGGYVKIADQFGPFQMVTTPEVQQNMRQQAQQRAHVAVSGAGNAGQMAAAHNNSNGGVQGVHPSIQLLRQQQQQLQLHQHQPMAIHLSQQNMHALSWNQLQLNQILGIANSVVQVQHRLVSSLVPGLQPQQQQQQHQNQPQQRASSGGAAGSDHLYPGRPYH